MDRFGGGNNDSGRSDNNLNYPAPPPAGNRNDTELNQNDTSRQDLNRPLVGNENYPMHPTHVQTGRFDLSGNVQLPQIQAPPMNYPLPPAMQEPQQIGQQYVKPQIHYNQESKQEKQNFDHSSAPLSSGNGDININLALPGMNPQFNQGVNMQNPQQYQQPQQNINLPPQQHYLPGQNPNNYGLSNQQGQQLNGSNVNLPQPQNYIPQGMPIIQDPQVPYHLQNNQVKNSNPQVLNAHQFGVNDKQPPIGAYQPPYYPMGAPIMQNPGQNIPQGQPVMMNQNPQMIIPQTVPNGGMQGQQYQQTILVVQRNGNNATGAYLPTNLDHCQYPSRMRCPACQREGTSQVINSTGGGAFTLCALSFCCIGVCSLCFLCIDNFQDKQHFCPNCGFQVGNFKYEPC